LAAIVLALYCGSDANLFTIYIIKSINIVKKKINIEPIITSCVDECYTAKAMIFNKNEVFTYVLAIEYFKILFTLQFAILSCNMDVVVLAMQ